MRLAQEPAISKIVIAVFLHSLRVVHFRLQWWTGARGRLAEGFSLDQAAKALATSKRSLARRMQSVLGKSPLAFFQDLRIERAVHVLRTSHASVDQIAAKVGYAEGVTLRALLRRTAAACTISAVACKAVGKSEDRPQPTRFIGSAERN
jgi:AraC-like DNA-binding protein